MDTDIFNPCLFFVSLFLLPTKEHTCTPLTRHVPKNDVFLNDVVPLLALCTYTLQHNTLTSAGKIVWGKGREWAGGVGDVSNACSAQNKCKTQENTEKIWQNKTRQLIGAMEKKIHLWMTFYLDVYLCCNLIFSDCSECVMSVPGTTKHSSCNQCPDTSQ